MRNLILAALIAVGVVGCGDRAELNRGEGVGVMYQGGAVPSDVDSHVRRLDARIDALTARLDSTRCNCRCADSTGAGR